MQTGSRGWESVWLNIRRAKIPDLSDYECDVFVGARHGGSGTPVIAALLGFSHTIVSWVLMLW